MADPIVPNFNITREQLAAFAKDPRTIRDLEAFLRMVREQLPSIVSVKVDETRLVSTDATLTGGHDLSTDVTLGIDLTAETERVQDIVGTALTDTATIDFTYSDVAGTITADVKAGSIGAAQLTDTAVTPGTYGDATHVAQITVDQDGRATSASSVAISFPGSGTVTTTGSPASGNLAKFSGATSVTSGDLSGDVTTSGTLAATIASGAVSLAKMANLAANSIIGNNTGSAATPLALNGTQVTAMLNTFTTTLKGLVPAPSTSTGKYLKDDGSWATPANGTGSGGLWSQVLSTTPTTSTTLLANTLSSGGSGATISNMATGVYINNPGGYVAAYTTAVPATPYSIVALVVGNNGTPALGWSDGTKVHCIYSTTSNITVQRYSNVNTGSTIDAAVGNSANLRMQWYKIRDDGTNVTFYYSNDGVNFISAYTIAKSSGYLGSSGYSHIFAGPAGGAGDTAVLSWTQGV
jgi:hypothetical protein